VRVADPLLDWFREALLSERVPPLRLHARDVDPDGAPAWHPDLWRWLTASPSDLVWVRVRTDCPHPATLGRPAGCRLCGGYGVVEHDAARSRYPLWSALRRLSASRRGREHVRVLARLAAAGCDPGRAGLDAQTVTAALRAVRMRWRE
jgi:hypothetical protein